MPLSHLIYTSTMLNREPEVLEKILETARHINNLRSITGMLLYANGTILQVLEGDDEDVNKTFQSIELDPRHRDIFVVSKVEIPERQFSSWDMGFKHLAETELGNSPIAAQVFNANKNEIAYRVKTGAALAMLVLFAQGIDVSDQP